MRGQELNRAVSISKEEREAVIKSLVSAGIDAKLVDAALNPAADGCGNTCCHTHQCDNYFSVNPDAMGRLQQEIKKRGINIEKINPTISKLLK